MHTFIRPGIFTAIVLAAFLFAGYGISAQSAGSSGSIYGTVTDASGAIVPGAAVSIQNPVSGYSRQTTTDNGGHYQFNNLPLNPYHLTISANGFGTVSRDADVRSAVPISLTTALAVGSAVTNVTVEAGDLIESDSTMHTDVDRGLFDKLPLESQSSSLSSLVTLASPGIAADSNGLFHGLGDHASNSFSIDGQPITDQQSKIFSNQLPSNSVQSLEVIDGAPTAEYGDKTSVVIVVTTRSGQGVTTPTGSVSASFGTFGSATGSVDLSYGGKNWGNFIEVDGLNTGRFLDPPEFSVFHDKGNEF
ncbi:MAG TPA: carboxypeptidase-like regulatory domain-containing protein, partial [Bryobacteraceae bacterium]